MLLPLLQNNVLEVGAVVATVSGDITNTEADIVAGHSTTVTITNDTLVAAGAAFDAIRQDLIDADTSAQSETFGFNNIVRDTEPVTSVTRVSDTVYRIDWSAAPTYNITADEVRTVTVPASALVTSSDPVIASPTIGITADAVVLENVPHTLSFSSVSANMSFAAVQRKTCFSSKSGAIDFTATNEPATTGFIVQVDGTSNIVLEQTGNVKRERP